MKMHTAGIVDEQTTLCTFVAGLPVSEYDFEIRQLSRKLSFDRDEVIYTIESQYNLLRSRRQKNSPAAHALVVDGRGGGGGRGHPGGKRGGRGGGRGGKHAEKKKSGDGNGAEANKAAAKGAAVLQVWAARPPCPRLYHTALQEVQRAGARRG